MPTEDELRHLAASLTDEDTALTSPPPMVWQRIEAAIAADRLDEAATVDTTETETETATATEAEAQAEPEGSVAAPIPIGRRQAARNDGFLFGRGSGRMQQLLAVAAAAVVLGGIAMLVVRPDSKQLASAELSSEGLGAESENVTDRPEAELIERDGHRELRVRIPESLSDSNHYLELWLIDTNVDGMVSLGPVTASGVYAIPDSVNPTKYPVVDVSLEPADGTPTHSGKSLLRAQLTFT
ncbi:MAG TPA: hypothetical protein DEG43_10590 [Acidimicrobiaceae bacterium]|nr:hypothetical protein [Acidimicrobiaceae bacterium]